MKKWILAFLILTLAASAGATCAVDEAVWEAPVFEAPFIVTTCGQSPGAVMFSMAAMQAGVKASYNNALTANDLKPEEFRTLVVTTGTSMKGMGAAGTDVNAEIARCLDIIKAAKAAGMTVVGAHIEGMARRTDSSDAASIDAVMKEADIILIVADSDSDGFFTKYAADSNKPMVVVKNALEIGPRLLGVPK
ncbi:MAG TPA: DUF6305 family protein [Candidatus Limnocylindria bacterium]|nr:DUF6305 family protein [Candidatus Limnocylindria bacterium]